MTTQHLVFKEEYRLEQLVLQAIASRYTGELERWEDPRGKWEDTYTPLDDTRDLIVELWGSYFTAETLVWFEGQLCKYGLKRKAWGPDAYCEEELEAECEQRLHDEAHDEWHREQQNRDASADNS